MFEKQSSRIQFVINRQLLLEVKFRFTNNNLQQLLRVKLSNNCFVTEFLSQPFSITYFHTKIIAIFQVFPIILTGKVKCATYVLLKKTRREVCHCCYPQRTFFRFYRKFDTYSVQLPRLSLTFSRPIDIQTKTKDKKKRAKSAA